MDWETVQRSLPGYPTRFYIRMPSPTSPEQVWTLLTYTQWIPIHKRYRYASQSINSIGKDLGGWIKQQKQVLNTRSASGKS